MSLFFRAQSINCKFKFDKLFILDASLHIALLDQISYSWLLLLFALQLYQLKHSIAKLSPSSSPSWAKLALVSLDPATHPPATPTQESLELSKSEPIFS